MLFVVQLLSRVRCFVTPWTAAHQASLSFTISWSLLKLMSIESVMPSNHLILCHPLLLPSIFPSIRFFSNELALGIRWPKYWTFSFSISPSNEYSGLISFRMDWLCRGEILISAWLKASPHTLPLLSNNTGLYICPPPLSFISGSCLSVHLPNTCNTCSFHTWFIITQLSKTISSRMISQNNNGYLK